MVYRLGRSLPGALRGPGIFIIVPCIDTFEKIDMRTQNFIVPPQDVRTILKNNIKDKILNKNIFRVRS